MKIKKYELSDRLVWDEFVGLAKNKHFFFYRSYMDYHAERFKDHSLMFFDDSEKLIALLPGNISNETLYSHQGLTFGGLILKASVKQKEVNEIVELLPAYLKKENLKNLIYKKIPYFYHTVPCDEDLYSLFRIKANLFRRDVTSVIKINNQIKYSKGRKWIVKKAASAGLVYSESVDVDSFWEHLNNVLMTAHGKAPIHSVTEIKLLKERFPHNIRFYSASIENNQVAGAVIFLTETTAHTQYLYNSECGREVGALDGLIDYLVKHVFESKEYFDFGISNEDQGRYLNEGLISQKEGFGARAITHEFYEIKAND